MVKEEINKAANKHKTRLDNHPNTLVANLMKPMKKAQKLKRGIPQDLIY